MKCIGIAAVALGVLMAGCGQTADEDEGTERRVASKQTEPGGGASESSTDDGGAFVQPQPPWPGAASDAGGSAIQGDGSVDFALGTGDLTLLVIFDKSGSMGTYWDSRSKWQVANDAFMAGIEGVLENLTIGTIFFPQPNGCDVAPLDGELQIDFMPGALFAQRWGATSESRAPDGSTPLELAFRVADGAIRNAQDLGLLDDRFRVIVVTDGEPTCNDDSNVLTTLPASWAERGVETHVLGLPGSSTAAALLDAIAAAGGTGAHQSPGEPGELADGLYALAR